MKSLSCQGYCDINFLKNDDICALTPLRTTENAQFEDWKITENHSVDLRNITPPQYEETHLIDNSELELLA